MKVHFVVNHRMAAGASVRDVCGRLHPGRECHEKTVNALILTVRLLHHARGHRKPFDVGPGEMLFFKKGTVHGMPEILEHPLFMVSVDIPP